MAAASMSMAVATARLIGVSARAETALSRNGAALSLAAPVAGSSSVSCAFSELAAVKRSGKNVAIVARAAEVFGDVAAEEVEAPVAEVFGDVATEEVEAPVEEVFGDVATEEVEAPVAEFRSEQQGWSKLYVGNLPWTCDSAQLAEICQDVGTVDAVEVIYDQESGRSRGFAFVTMASNEDAQAVINALDGSDLGGRALRVNFPQSKSDRPRYERSERPDRSGGGGERRGSLQADNPNKLFVGNLSWGCDEGALIQLFSDYGQVVDAKVVYDRESGRSRGFGFVTLAGATEVNAAIENLDGAQFDGRQLRVNLAGDKPPPRQY